LSSVWRTAYPEDGSYCPPGSCSTHSGVEFETRRHPAKATAAESPKVPYSKIKKVA
jgi:hypothetical protein